MPVREVPEKFQVAFSFAGEQRDLVRSIAELVEKDLGEGTVFLDEWFEYYIAGDDADLKLQQIYGERSVLAVVCISERYGDKPWTQAEHSAIRARLMKARASRDKHDDLGILPIRVGDGEVQGILFNTIAPDVRALTVVKAAELVIARLGLIVPDVGKGMRTTPDWPEQPPALHWPMADHSEAREAFERLVTRTAPWRCLLLRGPSETGKSHITKQMLRNALHVPNLACGRFDFKGTTGMDAEVRAFVQELGVPLPAAGPRLVERVGEILDALKRRGQPALLIFDTYEAAGEAEDWVEKQLLPSLVRATWLRVVIVGQRVPERTGAIWEADACPLIALKPPAPEDWFTFGQMHKADITLDFVRQAHQYVGGKGGVLAELLGPKR